MTDSSSTGDDDSKLSLSFFNGITIFNYLGEWVEITGKISQAGDIIKEIEIEKLKKIPI
jgi:hypothetical protein